MLSVELLGVDLVFFLEELQGEVSLTLRTVVHVGDTGTEDVGVAQTSWELHFSRL